MTVYVDDMFKYPMGQFRRMKMSHLIADTEEELHAMAQKIGVARKWYQGDHYDICMSMREQAVKLGAVEITLKQCGCMCSVRKMTGKLPKPEEAKELMIRLMDERKAVRAAE